jgi:Flp pilus assembly protein TadD
VPKKRAGGRRRRRDPGSPRGSAAPRAESRRSIHPALVAAALAILTVAAFAPVLRNEFVNYDDPEYVVANSVVREGLTPRGVQWALTTGRAANWHPLTWLSHMADVSLFGLDPAGHHATSLLLHVGNVLLLFALFRRTTGDTGRSAVVAGLFAVHPAHVESVAWVAERKDVLSTAFGLAAMLAYAAWVRRRGPARYGLVLLLFALGLTAKPMLVSLPLVLLLFDEWPLARSTSAAARIVEKLPLFVLAAASSAVTLVVQSAGGAVRAEYPIGVRLGNAAVSIVRYLEMLVRPRLSVFHPYETGGPGLAAGLAAAAAVGGICGAAIALRRRAPYFFVGWFWFVAMLLPVLGLVQVGKQAYADRYTYLSYVGLFAAIVWGASALGARSARLRPALRVAAIAVLAALAAASFSRTRVWKNSETLFADALEKNPDNYLASVNLGNFDLEAGRTEDAIARFRDAERSRPDEPEVHVGLGYALLLLGRQEEAARSFEHVLELDPRHGVAANNLARLRFLDGEISESVKLYRTAVAARPDWGEGRRRLAVALLMEDRTTEAIGELERAVALDPADTEARSLLAGARALSRGGGPEAAALRAFLADAHRQAAAALARRGYPERAGREGAKAQARSIPAR